MKPNVITVLSYALIIVLSGNRLSAQQHLPDGKIVEMKPFQILPYDSLSERWKRTFSRQAVEAMRNDEDLEFSRIIYLSDGLKIAGFIYKPTTTPGKKLPVIIWNHGGVGEDSKIGNTNFNDIYEMNYLAKQGFIVVASQYRGIDGSEGKDECGGADTHDVLNLFPLLKSLPYADTSNIFMWGFSRGALMTLQAIRNDAKIKAAVVVGAPTDLETGIMEFPPLLDFVKEISPDFENGREEYSYNRSPAKWADKIDVPLLVLHGGNDFAVSPHQELLLIEKLEEYGKLYQFQLYALDDHGVTNNTQDRLQKTADWFKNPRLMPISNIMRKIANAENVETAIKKYSELKKTHADKFDFGERQLNDLGYEFLLTGRISQAIQFFLLNVEMYPASANAYDSLGEAYAAKSEKENAIKNFKKSLKLNPGNENAKKALKALGVNL